jgi:hypothetical protein
MKKPFKVKSKEFGRGKASTASFATLAGAATYIRDRWEGPDYIDCKSWFHTDYCTYELVGFTLHDIGKMTWAGEAPHYYREFVFNPEMITEMSVA